MTQDIDDLIKRLENSKSSHEGGFSGYACPTELEREAAQAMRKQQAEIERLKALPYAVLEIMAEHDISPRIAREIVDLMTIHKMSAKQVWDTYGDRQI